MNFQHIKIKSEWKLAFLSTLIIGFLAHIYIFTNSFPNHDGLFSIYSTQNCIHSGRWFLQIACLPSSYYTLPAVIGLLSILYISITSVIIVELFSIQNKFNIIMTSAFLILFPTVASNFAYIYTMDGYMLALLLSSLSVLVTYKYKYGFCIGSILLCFSIGIYQSYISFAIILCIIKILISFIKNDKNHLKEIISDFLLIFLGFVLYYVILKILITIQCITLTDYQGVNQLVNFQFSNVFHGIIQAYKSFIAFPIKSNFFSNNLIILICNIISILLLVFLYFKNYISKKIYKNWLTNVLLIVVILIIPLYFNTIMLLSSSAHYHMLMRYTWCLPYIALIVMIEHFCNKTFYKIIYAICAICILFNFYIISNIAYFNMEQKFEKTYSFAIRLIDRIEQCDGYAPDMPIAIIGSLSEDKYPYTDITLPITKDITGSQGSIILFEPYHYESFFKNYMNFTIQSASNEQIKSIVKTNEYKQMSTWPDSKSVGIINNILVVNLSKRLLIIF